ncbi:MAG: MFS transporter [Deltaproteobacteria bacterium]|nr:MFS transporter [Deltaproteobacteria bacterium]
MKAFNLKVLLLLSLGHLITDVYQSALPTILPFLKEKLDLTYTMTGVILMTASFTSSLIQPLFGFLTDKQEKPLLLPLGCLCAGIGFSFLALAPSYLLVLALVVVSGLGIASYHPEGYKTAHFFTGERRVTGMAVFAVGGSSGFALGPIIAVYTIQYLGLSSLPLMALPAVLFAVLIFVNWQRIALPAESPGQTTKASVAGASRGNYWGLAIIIAIVMVRSWIQFGLMTYIPFYYINFLKGDPLYASKLVFVFLLGAVVGTLAGAPLADRWGHKRYLTWSMLLSAILLPFTLMVASGAVLFVALGLLGMVCISTFSLTVVMAQRMLPSNLGMASGLMVGFAIGAGGICVTFLGVLADHFGVPFALKSIAILPLIGLILCLILKYPEEVLGRR